MTAWTLFTGGFACAAGPVVGVKECDLFSAEKLEKQVASLKAGDKVDVLKSLPDKLQVRIASGKTGWVRQCALCSEEECTRRAKASEIPENLICIGSDDKEGGMFMYGGSVLEPPGLSSSGFVAGCRSMPPP